MMYINYCTSVWGKKCLAAMLLETASSLIIITGHLLAKPDDRFPTSLKA